MLGFIFFLILIVIVVVTIKVIKDSPTEAVQDNTSTEEILANANYLLLLGEVKRQAEEHGDTETVQAVLNMTYKGPMPEKQPDGSFSSIYANYLKCNIAGINFRKGINDYVGKFIGYLTPETTNQHDPNAIAIYHQDGHHLGYIPAEDTDDVRALGLPFPIRVYGEIEEDYDDTEDRKFFHGHILIEIPNMNKQ